MEFRSRLFLLSSTFVVCITMRFSKKIQCNVNFLNRWGRQRAFRMSVFVFSRIPKMQQFALAFEKDRLVIDIHVKRHFSSGISYPDLFESRFQILFSQFWVESLVTRTIFIFPSFSACFVPIQIKTMLNMNALFVFFSTATFQWLFLLLLCTAQVNFYEIYIFHSKNLWKRHTTVRQKRKQEYGMLESHKVSFRKEALGVFVLDFAAALEKDKRLYLKCYFFCW